MHVIHTWILMNKEYILNYILALSEGLENQGNISNTFIIYLQEASMGGFRRGGDQGGHITLIKTIIFKSHNKIIENMPKIPSPWQTNLPQSGKNFGSAHDIQI